MDIEEACEYLEEEKEKIIRESVLIALLKISGISKIDLKERINDEVKKVLEFASKDTYIQSQIERLLTDIE